MKINGNPSDKVSTEQQSNKFQQVQANTDESPKRSKKRKSFPKKKRKRTKQQKTKTKNGKLVQHRHQAEDFVLGGGENNYSTAANNCENENDFNQVFQVKNRLLSEINSDNFSQFIEIWL